MALYVFNVKIYREIVFPAIESFRSNGDVAGLLELLNDQPSSNDNLERGLATALESFTEYRGCLALFVEAESRTSRRWRTGAPRNRVNTAL